MMMSSVLTSTVLRHQRHHLVKTLSLSPLLLLSTNTTPPSSSSSNYSTSTTLHARPGSTNNHADRNPKIKITLEQLRMAARGSGRRAPICHEAQERVMNSLEAAKYEVCVCVVIVMLVGCKCLIRCAPNVKRSISLFISPIVICFICTITLNRTLSFTDTSRR
jgi:hypothetical protein